MTHYRDSWPNLWDALEEVTDSYRPEHDIHSYDELQTDEQDLVLAALVKDIPESDSGELTNTAPGQYKDFAKALSRFFKSPVLNALELHKEWKRGLEETYKHHINALIEEIEAMNCEARAERLRENQPYYHWPLTHKQEQERLDNRERLRGILR